MDASIDTQPDQTVASGDLGDFERFARLDYLRRLVAHRIPEVDVDDLVRADGTPGANLRLEENSESTNLYSDYTEPMGITIPKELAQMLETVLSAIVDRIERLEHMALRGQPEGLA
jgi:hypothetical protein